MTAALGSITTTVASTIDSIESEIRSYLVSKENFGLEKPSAATLKKINELISVLHLLNSGKTLSALDKRNQEKAKMALAAYIYTKQEKIIKDCASIYTQAQECCLPFLIGDSSLRENLALLVNFGILSTDDTSINKSLVSLIPNIKTGSIFCPSPWSLTRNDFFMLGATRSNHPFYIAKETITADNIWNKTSEKMTTLGREICILHFSGYIQACPEEGIKNYGYVFIKDEKEKKPCLSITELDNAISKIKDPETILDFLKFIKKK